MFTFSLIFLIRFVGKYEYRYIGKRPPKGMCLKHDKYKMYGWLDGLNGEDFAYVKQASSSVTLFHGTFQAESDIYFNHNFHCNDDNLYNLFLAFPEYIPNFNAILKVSVQFNLKESYFEDLILSIKDLTVVSRLVPDSFATSGKVQNLDNCREYCTDEQFKALQTILNSSPRNPPILLTGAFGTRKSRLLALCTLHLLSQTTTSPVCILVCTHQQFSAEKFLKYCKTIFWESSKPRDIVMICDYQNAGSSDRMSSVQFKNYWHTREKNNSLLVITTCLNTTPLKRYLPKGYFDHIFIDECSHMLEPEAIAPLFFANKDTKIVLAGDVQQVSHAQCTFGVILYRALFFLAIFFVNKC